MKAIPNNIVKEIDKNLWDFLWDRKQPSVNKQAMCLCVENGGMNMINVNHFIEAKRIKFIYSIINSETEHWNMIGKNWLRYLDFFINALTLKDCKLLFRHSFTVLCRSFLSSPHLCFIIVFICDLFVSRDDPLMS